MSQSSSDSGAVGSRVHLTAGTLDRYSTSGLVLLPRSGAPVKLNPPAAAVWEGLRSGRDRAEVVGTMAEEFEQDRNVVAPLVDDAIGYLIRSELAYCSP